MMAGGSTTSASVFRTNDQVRGTFVLDEADFRASEMWSDIVKILNGGQTQGSPVIRMEPKGDGFITKAFHVFGPKVLASREQFADKALESRCLTQIMLPQEKVLVPVHLPENFEAVRDALKKQGFAPQTAEVTMVSSTTVKLIGETAQQMIRLVSALEDHDDVQAVHANFDIADEEIERLS